MARLRWSCRIGFVALILACPACMAPGAAAPAAPAAAAAGPAPFASADPDLAPPTSALGKCCAAMDDLRRKICKTQCGQMLNAMTMPLSGLTGGVIPTFCPDTPGLKDLAKPGVLGEAAAVKKDAQEAKARREAVRLLGTVDCRYYADAEGKLIAALRTDGSECVRYEAALALGRGCCCTKNVMKALDITVAGLDTDGNPVECSERVRDAAAEALQRCLACVPPEPDEQLPPPKKGSPERPDENEMNGSASRKPDAETIRRAKATLASYTSKKPAAPNIEVAPTEKSLLSLIRGVDAPAARPTAEAATQPKAPRQPKRIPTDLP
jgi:hypothetical protein